MTLASIAVCLIWFFAFVIGSPPSNNHSINEGAIRNTLPPSMRHRTITDVTYAGNLTFVKIGRDIDAYFSSRKPPRTSRIGKRDIVTDCQDPISGYLPDEGDCENLVNQLSNAQQTTLVQPGYDDCTAYGTCASCYINRGSYQGTIDSGMWGFFLLNLRSTCLIAQNQIGLSVDTTTCQAVTLEYIAEWLPEYQQDECMIIDG